MKKFFLDIRPVVYEDVIGIYNYICKSDLQVAYYVASEIWTKIDSLDTFPNRGANLQNIINRPTKYKFIIACKSYAILYLVEDDTVKVTHVRHMARDLAALKF